MKTFINYDKIKTQSEFLEGGRIYYSKPLNDAWKALKQGQDIILTHEASDTGWSMVYVTIDGVESQLTKKQIRTSDLKYYFGGS